MKANCRRRRHSRHTVAHATSSDPFLLAQWQSNSSHVWPQKPARPRRYTPARLAMKYEHFDGFTLSSLQSSAGWRVPFAVVARVTGKNRIMIYGAMTVARIVECRRDGKPANSRDRACRGRPVQSSRVGIR